VLYGGQGARAAELNLAHVADVEEAHAGADGQVLGDETSARAGVLDRHIPAAEVHHFGLEGAMDGVEWGPLERQGDGGGLVLKSHVGGPLGGAAVLCLR